MRGGTSGIGVELTYRVVVTFHNGEIVLDEWCADRAEALEAVGLAGLAMSQENVDRLRAGIEAFRRTGEVDVAFLAPDFELHHASSIVDTAGVFHGRGALETPASRPSAPRQHALGGEVAAGGTIVQEADVAA